MFSIGIIDGDCLPKDLGNLIAFGKEIGTDLSLFRAVKGINEPLKIESRGC